jgi:hypothetical protein
MLGTYRLSCRAVSTYVLLVVLSYAPGLRVSIVTAIVYYSPKSLVPQRELGKLRLLGQFLTVN